MRDISQLYHEGLNKVTLSPLEFHVARCASSSNFDSTFPASNAMATLEAIKYSRGKLLVLDQLRLPHEHHYDEVTTSEEAFDCIRSMRVRGRPRWN